MNAIDASETKSRPQVSAGSWLNDGENENIHAPFTQVAQGGDVALKVRICQWVAAFVLLAFVCGRLALFGNHFSTVSAHSATPLTPAFLLNQSLARRPRRRQPETAAAAILAASYSRYSSDLQDESSIEQQQRRCREAAEGNKHELLKDFEYSDSAVSGTKRERAGLNALLAAAKDGRFRVVYFDSLSRLARESVITMPMLKDLVYNHRVRIVSVSEGIDSHNNNWDLMANFMSWVHEQYIKALRAAVLRGQEHAILNDWSAGDWCLGYGSEPIPGTETGRRGRHPRPRMKVIVNEEHAKWVRQIFIWFVDEKKSIAWIARELTRLGAPKDHRSSTPDWHPEYVRRVLRNEKYIGIWPWGQKTNVRNPLTGQLMQEGRPPEETAKWVRERPHLRLVEDSQFFRAQAILDDNDDKCAAHRGEKGKLTGSPAGFQKPRHLLQGIFGCACEETFQVSGANGKYLGCVGYKKGSCTCKTRLPRKLAEVMILQTISDRIFANQTWLEAVLAEGQGSWDQHQGQRPDDLSQAQKNLDTTNQKIRRLLDAIENGEGDPVELKKRLLARQEDKRDQERQVVILKAASSATKERPTREWMETELRQMHEVLRGQGAQANEVLKKLVGGRIVLHEATEPGRKRKYLIGEFTLDSAAVLSDGCRDSAESVVRETIRIEFRSSAPWASVMHQVKALFDARYKYRAIAAKLGIPRSWVAKALALWQKQNGLPPLDGRTQKARLDQQTLVERLADRVKELWDGEMPMQAIAAQLKCCRDIVTAAIRHWFESRGLPVPDGRNRRKELRERRDAS